MTAATRTRKRAAPPRYLDTATATNPFLAQQIKSLADPTRLRIVGMLHAAADGLSVSAIGAALGDLAQSTVSHHLRALAHAGLVTSERADRFTVYRLAVDEMNALCATLAPPPVGE